MGKTVTRKLMEDPADYDGLEQGDRLEIPDIRSALERGRTVSVRNTTKDRRFEARHTLSPRQIEMILSGSLINVVRNRRKARVA